MIGHNTYVDLIREGFNQARCIINNSKAIEDKFVEREIKLSTDLELDVYFRDFLEKKTGLPVYSEESLGGSPLKGKCWIVDPLDGSLNFYRNIPFYTSSIALWESGLPILGFIYDYVHDEFYMGDVNQGASLNGEMIQVNTISNSKSIKATGIPSQTNVNDSLAMFKESLIEYKKLRWMGCASLSLAYVANGRVDAYEENGIKLWDVAAGIAIVKAAGGRISFTFNEDGSLNVSADSKVV